MRRAVLTACDVIVIVEVVVIFLLSHVEERSWWLVQSPSKGRKKKAKGLEERDIRSSLLILDLKDGKLSDSGKEEEGKMFHNMHVLGMNDDLWDRVRELGSETWKGCNSSSSSS